VGSETADLRVMHAYDVASDLTYLRVSCVYSIASAGLQQSDVHDILASDDPQLLEASTNKAIEKIKGLVAERGGTIAPFPRPLRPEPYKTEYRNVHKGSNA